MASVKIAILTQPLGHNYGGLLQAYALQTVIKNLGGEAETLNRRKPVSRLKAARDYLKASVKFARGRIKNVPTEKKKRFVFENLQRFRNETMKLSPLLTSAPKLEQYCKSRRFDAFVVGSDQVWRPRYSPDLTNFFLDFTLSDELSRARKISYAASFGVDDWEFCVNETATCGSLLQRFDAVSVREESAVELCRDRLGVNAEWVLDPTMLLPREHYESIASSASGSGRKEGILCYVLDPSEFKRDIVRHVEHCLGHDSFSIKPEKSLSETRAEELMLCQYPGVEEWLRGFKEAGFVVTDSFHGAVFAILFNKPFVAIGNSKHGLSRFTSLLGLFSLDDRLVTSVGDCSPELLGAEIRWQDVNAKLGALVDESIAFLSNSLDL